MRIFPGSPAPFCFILKIHPGSSALYNCRLPLTDPNQHRYNQALSPSHNHSRLCPCTYETSDNPILSDCSHKADRTCVVVSPCGFQNRTYCNRYATPWLYTMYRPAFSQSSRKSPVSKNLASGSNPTFFLP